MLFEAVELFERAVIQQELKALARRHLSRGVLALDTLVSTAGESSGVLLGKFLQAIGSWFFFDLAFRRSHCDPLLERLESRVDSLSKLRATAKGLAGRFLIVPPLQGFHI